MFAQTILAVESHAAVATNGIAAVPGHMFAAPEPVGQELAAARHWTDRAPTWRDSAALAMGPLLDIDPSIGSTFFDELSMIMIGGFYKSTDYFGSHQLPPIDRHRLHHLSSLAEYSSDPHTCVTMSTDSHLSRQKHDQSAVFPLLGRIHSG